MGVGNALIVRNEWIRVPCSLLLGMLVSLCELSCPFAVGSEWQPARGAPMTASSFSNWGPKLPRHPPADSTARVSYLIGSLSRATIGIAPSSSRPLIRWEWSWDS